MEADMESLMNLPVVQMDLRHLYAIIAVLGAAVVACTCVTAYSLNNYFKLKQNSDILRSYVDSQVKMADLQSDSNAWRDAAGTRSPAVMDLVQAASVEPRMNKGAPNSTDASAGETAGGTVAAMGSQKVSGAQSLASGSQHKSE